MNRSKFAKWERKARRRFRLRAIPRKLAGRWRPEMSLCLAGGRLLGKRCRIRNGFSKRISVKAVSAKSGFGRHETLKKRLVFKFCFDAKRVRSLKREVTIFRLLERQSRKLIPTS